MPHLVLASTSPYRRALLERLGLPFQCLAPRIDEDDWKVRISDLRELAQELAKAKAESLRNLEPGATVIGSDQLVDFQGQRLGKPGTFERAVEQLMRMQGQTHTLITSVAICHKEQTFLHTNETRMSMRQLTVEEIERYVHADRPFDCAGSYKLEERGIALFERIDTSDYTAIMGLPLIAVTTQLRALGFSIP